MNIRIALWTPLATVSRWCGRASSSRTHRREWGAYFGSFGDDFFSDDD